MPPSQREPGNRYGWRPPSQGWTNPLEVLSVGVPDRDPHHTFEAVALVVEVRDLGGPMPRIAAQDRAGVVMLPVTATVKSAGLLVAGIRIYAERAGLWPALEARIDQELTRMRRDAPDGYAHLYQEFGERGWQPHA